MNNPLHKLSSLKATKLSEKERAALRGDIVAFMRANPVNEVVKAEEPLLRRRSDAMKTETFSRRSSLDEVRNPDLIRHHIHAGKETSFTAFITVKRKRMMSAMLIAMFVLSGGVSFAAQGSLPGDTLYPVKIHVNEQIESTLAVGAKADAEVARKQLERRAQEAAQLQAENRLSAEVKAELAADAEVHAAAYKKAEATLTHKGESAAALEVKTEMQATITTHQNAFNDLGVSINIETLPSASTEQSTSLISTGSGSVDATLDASTQTQIELPTVQTESKGSGSVQIGL